MKKLVKMHPNVCLHLYGDGREKNRVMKEVIKNNLENHVIFKGIISNIPNIIKNYDIMMPSMDEGFGLAVLEGMAVGLPIIISNVGGMTELINNKNGLVIEEQDPNEYIECIVNLINDQLLLMLKKCNDINVLLFIPINISFVLGEDLSISLIFRANKISIEISFYTFLF